MTRDQILTYAACLFASFITVGIKGFQHKNVIANKVKLVAITSYVMALGDVLMVSLIVKGGWTVAFFTATGAAFGMVLSMKLHDRLFASRE